MRRLLLHLRKWGLVFTTLSLLVLMTGCWSSVELNRRAFARIMMIDETDNGIKLTLGIPLPNRVSSGAASVSGGDKEPYTNISQTGKSIGDAYRILQGNTTRSITFGQLRNIVIGGRFAKSADNMLDLADFLSREPLIHINSNVFMTEKPASEFEKVPAVTERFPSLVLASIASEKDTLIMTTRDILMAIYGGGDFLLPRLVFKDTPDGSWVGTDGAGIFSKGKYIDLLDTAHTQVLMWLHQKEKGVDFNLASPVDGENVTFLLQGSKAKIIPVVRGDDIHFITKCKVQASLLSADSNTDFTDPKEIKKLENELAKEFNTLLKETFAQFGKLKVDPVQLGAHLRWRYPRVWEKVKPQWKQEYLEHPIEPKIAVTVKWTGAIKMQNWQDYLSGKRGE